MGTGRPQPGDLPKLCYLLLNKTDFFLSFYPHVGRIIGKSGDTIKALQQYTGAMIQIDQSQDPTRVTIAGDAHSLRVATSMVKVSTCTKSGPLRGLSAASGRPCLLASGGVWDAVVLRGGCAVASAPRALNLCPCGRRTLWRATSKALLCCAK